MVPAHADSIQAQREAFRAAYAEAEKGNWQPAAENQQLLAGYVLWPDLQAVYLRRLIRRARYDDAEIRAFLDEYGELRPARELRYQYALRLAAERRLDDYLELYRKHYEGRSIARLDCLALRADLTKSGDEAFRSRAEQLWMTGHSQVKECDPVFDSLREQGHLDTELYRERFELAISERQFGLARYLAGPLDGGYREQASSWLSAQQKPVEFIRSQKSGRTNSAVDKQLAYAVERVAYRDPERASILWQELEPQHEFSDEQRAATNRHIALWSARNHMPDARQQLSSLPAGAIDTEVHRWLVRTSLRKQDWQEVLGGIEDMLPDERGKEEWRYWRAFAMQENGAADDAAREFRNLAAERSYYGFLAADAVQEPYRFSHEDIVTDEEILKNLASRTDFIRARELFLVGLDGRGRSEWDQAVATLADAEKAQAAVLAGRWGWHSRAISTVAKAEQFDDLHIRFPLPYRTSFTEFSSQASVRPSWAYGVARSESLFMRDVRSSAGAVGLMQLMPATGKDTAQEIDFPYSGLLTLIDPNSNIRLGTYYLGKMYDRFDNNFVLATAAYNAGPHRVERWLPEAGSLDARIWIENIPYNETRKYVRRVAETDVIFHWRLTGDIRRLSDELVLVSSRGDDRDTATLD